MSVPQPDNLVHVEGLDGKKLAQKLCRVEEDLNVQQHCCESVISQ